jgi:hypothetical protein
MRPRFPRLSSMPPRTSESKLYAFYLPSVIENWNCHACLIVSPHRRLPARWVQACLAGKVAKPASASRYYGTQSKAFRPKGRKKSLRVSRPAVSIIARELRPLDKLSTSQQPPAYALNVTFRGGRVTYIHMPPQNVSRDTFWYDWQSRKERQLGGEKPRARAPITPPPGREQDRRARFR